MMIIIIDYYALDNNKEMRLGSVPGSIRNSIMCADAIRETESEIQLR